MREARPRFLEHRTRALAAKRFFAVEHFRLDLIVAKFQFPTFVVERDNLTGWILPCVKKGRQEPSRSEAFALIRNCSCYPDLWQGRILGSRRRRNVHFNQRVAFIKTLELARAQVLLPSRKPVPVVPFSCQRDQNTCAKEAPVYNRERIVGHRRPQVTCIAVLTRLIGSKSRRSQQVRTKGHQANKARQWITAFASLALRTPKVRAVLIRIRDTQCRAVDAIQRELSPPVGGGARMRPVLRGALKKPGQGLGSKSTPSLGNGALGDRGQGSREREIEFVDNLHDRTISEECHPNDQPNDLFSRQTTLAQRGGASRLQCLLYPLGIDMATDIFEAFGGDGGDVGQRRFKMHGVLARFICILR